MRVLKVLNSNLRLLFRNERFSSIHPALSMMIYAHNDLLMCLIFPSSLKGATSDWFYSLFLHFLHEFEEVTEAFLTQYASHRGQE